MYAIIEDSGTQIKVQKGDVLEIDHRVAEEGSDLVFDKVLLTGDGEGKATIGQPYVDGATVTAKVLGPKLGKKIDVIKFRRRTTYRRKTGHRQQYLAVEVTDIAG